jgi:uncharacterized protein YcnI
MKAFRFPPVRSTMVMHRFRLVLGVALGALALPAAAGAHVTIQPSQAVPGAFTVENVRVPTERDDAATVKVDVQLPNGFAAVSYEAIPGWKVKVTKAKLSTPIQTDDGPITEGVRQITWTADSKGDGIQPGAFRDFPISVQIPGKVGQKLTFKALQTYSDGQVVRWIGAPDADQPAPQLTLVAAAGASSATTPQSTVTTPAGMVMSDPGGGGASKGLAFAALVAGVLGIALGGLALMHRHP